MTDTEFGQHLRVLMRRDPALVEQFLRRQARINGRPPLARSAVIT